MDIPPNIIGILAFLLFFVFVLVGLPIAFAFAFAGFVGLWWLSGFGAALNILPVVTWGTVSDYVLIALPLYVLMGEFANVSGIGPDLYNASLKWWGKLPGGLAITTTWGCCAFGALTGSSTAGVLAFTPIAFKPMMDLGYDKKLAAGTIVASATMGIMIPPSISFILYGVQTNESIGKLFIAGIVPGILQALLYTTVILAFTISGIWKGPPGPASKLSEKIKSLKNLWGMIVIFFLVIGSMYLGIATPTEAAALGATGTFVILVSRYGFKLSMLSRSISESLRTVGMLIFIILCSLIFTKVIVLSGLADWLVALVAPTGGNVFVPLASCIIILLFAGMLMPATAMILLFTPLFYPVIVQGLGFNGIWFGVIIVLMSEAALITPPVALNIFAFKSQVGDEVSMLDIGKSVLPFLGADFFRLLLLILFPAIATWLPSRMFTF
ncbi:MAG: TRAP transporter large permease [Dehalococcoidales bacterium]|nr:TRAP transporter large permease [Dehalococcoidales bacterium]